MNFDNSYFRELQGAYVVWQPAPASRPSECFFNHELAIELGGDWLVGNRLRREAIFGGNEIPPGAQPIAQAYAGHQFGGFSPQLGDGRALLLGEVIDARGQRRDIALKGSGRTPFSRGGDGKAAIGPMLREVLIGEALHALGIPTTRALAVVATGDWVHREQTLPGAVLTRVADSHLRVGTFEYFAARGDLEGLRRLVAYAVQRHPPSPADRDAADEDLALALLSAVMHRQAELISRWMSVGFIHGVMNTDNMSMSGQSIDFGPCAFMEVHDPATVYSSIDRQGRYAYGRQPAIAQWNLARLAEALLPTLQGPDEERLARARRVVEDFTAVFEQAMTEQWRGKLGLSSSIAGKTVRALAQDWQALLQAHRIDHTLGWHALYSAETGDTYRLNTLFPQGAQVEVRGWLSRWRDAAASTGQALDATAMRRHNPLVIPRNHHVEAALYSASAQGDLQPFESLLEALRKPYEASAYPYAEPAPPEIAAGHRTYCGT